MRPSPQCLRRIFSLAAPSRSPSTLGTKQGLGGSEGGGGGGGGGGGEGGGGGGGGGCRTVVPLSRYTWSGPGCPRHVMRCAHAVQPVSKPLPGFCQAAAAFARTVRFLQSHWPFVSYAWFAWTDTQ